MEEKAMVFPDRAKESRKAKVKGQVIYTSNKALVAALERMK